MVLKRRLALCQRRIKGSSIGAAKLNARSEEINRNSRLRNVGHPLDQQSLRLTPWPMRFALLQSWLSYVPALSSQRLPLRIPVAYRCQYSPSQPQRQVATVSFSAWIEHLAASGGSRWPPATATSASAPVQEQRGCSRMLHVAGVSKAGPLLPNLHQECQSSTASDHLADTDLALHSCS
jgi:hypothetical protein